MHHVKMTPFGDISYNAFADILPPDFVNTLFSFSFYLFILHLFPSVYIHSPTKHSINSLVGHLYLV